VADSDDPLFFLMQINLSEVSPFDVAGLLPKAGMLWFFFHWTDEFNSEVPFILHRKRIPRRLERRDWPADLPEESRFRGLELEPRLEWTIPSLADSGLAEDVYQQHYDFWEAVEERVSQVQGFGQPCMATPTHRLLGHPQLIQGPGLADGTELLLQVDSDPPRRLKGRHPETGMMWGDCGRIYYLIGEDELKTRRFAEEPWTFVEMS